MRTRLTTLVMAVAVMVMTAGCSFMPRTINSLNYQEARPGSTSPFIGSSSGTMVPMLFAGAKLPDLDTANGEAVVAGDDGKERLIKASGLFTQNGVFSRQSETDSTAALQQLKGVKGSGAGMASPTAQDGGTVGDTGPVSPQGADTTSLPIAYQGPASVAQPASSFGGMTPEQLAALKAEIINAILNQQPAPATP